MDLAATGEQALERWQDTLKSAIQASVGRYRDLGALPDARRLLSAAAGSYVGSEFNAIALIALSYSLSGGAFGVGGMLIVSSLPRLLVQGPAGALVDRYPGPRLLILTQCLLAVLAAGFALLVFMPSIWLLYGLIFVSGVVGTVDVPAFELRLMNLVPPAQRGTANALHVLAMSSSGLVGPMLGGVVLGLFGALPLFVLNSVSFLTVAATVSRLRPAHPAAVAAEPTAEAAAATARTGYGDLLRRPGVALYTALVVTSSVFGVTAITLLIVRAHELGLGDGGVGMFFTVSALGALLGGVVAGGGSYDGPRAFVVTAAASIAWIVALALFGFANSLMLAVPMLLLAGIMGQIEEIAGLTAFQNHLPESVYGRVFSLFLIAGAAGALAGGLLGPALAETAGTGPSLVLLGIPVVALAVVFGIRLGNIRPALNLPTVPALEPEVAGHGLFGLPTPRPAARTFAPVRAIPVPRVYRPG